MDGREFFEKWNEQQDSHDAPIVIMRTGVCDDAVHKQAMKAGASLVRQKTSDLHQCIARARKVFAP